MDLEYLKTCSELNKRVFFDDKMWHVVHEMIDNQDVVYLKKYVYDFKSSTDWTPNIYDIKTIFVNDDVLKDIKYVRTMMKKESFVDEHGKECQGIKFIKCAWDEPGNEVIDEFGNIVCNDDGIPLI